MTVLTAEQAQQYAAQSYLLVSGLIPEAVAESAETALWRLLEAQPDDPSTWPARAAHQAFDSPELAACYTSAMLGAAALAEQPTDAAGQSEQRAPGGTRWKPTS